VSDSIKWRGELISSPEHNADVMRVISYEAQSCRCSILLKIQGEFGKIRSLLEKSKFLETFGEDVS
jgi:hypothetical protein